jgi:NAD-dependent dihydropyrimidine dehydrogenase PreA subunit
VQWFSHTSEEIDETTGMWTVTADCEATGSPALAVDHDDCILCAACLIPISGESFVSDEITHNNSLDHFKGFHVNGSVLIMML